MSARLLAAFALLAASALLQAQPLNSRDYQVLDPPRPVATGQRIEVIEFFYYGCPVCYETQPHISRWLARTGIDVTLRRVPVISKEGEGWESFARTYYALEALGQLARLHFPVYDNHHFDARKLNEEDKVVEWVGQNGIDAAKFRELWRSPEITARLEEATRTRDAYEVTGVPIFIIDGKYRTSARLAGGVKEMMAVVEALVVRARDERPRQ